jgi:predicted GNAT family acetyltransferase
LVRGVLALVRQRGDKVVPLCPFVEHYMRRHPEVHDLLAAPAAGERPGRRLDTRE